MMGITVLGVFPARESDRSAFFSDQRGRLAISSKRGIVYPEELDLDKFVIPYIILIRFNKGSYYDDTE